MSQEDKKRVTLVRMPDGSMRPSTDTEDIGNVWLTQKQIKQQAIEEEARAKASKQKTGNIPKKPTASNSAAKPTPAPLPQTKEIAISLSVPKFKALPVKSTVKRGVAKLKTVPKWGYAVAVLVALPVIFVASAAITNNPSKNSTDAAVLGAAASSVPDFQVLLPNGDVTDTVSQKVQYDAKRKVANYTDKVDGVDVTISQQPLPEDFKKETSARIKALAEQFSANESLAVKEGKAYVGTSPKGPQSVVAYRGDSLIFVQSASKVKSNAWVEFLDSLK